MRSELDDKTDRLARLARESEAGGVLLASQPAFSWLTGGGTNRVDGSRENGSGALFVRHDGARFVIANAIEMPRLLAEELRDSEWTAIDYPWTDDHAQPETLARLARQAAGGAPRIGADLPLAGTVGLDRALVRARAALHPNEVERYRCLGAEAGAAIGALCRSLAPGRTEQEIAQQVVNAAAGIGARAIVTLVAADDRIARFRHPLPTTRSWVRLVMVVACIQRQGLVVALSRLVASGPLPEDLAARTVACARVFERLLDTTRPGALARDLFASAQQGYALVGFPGEEARHHQGGAIGYRSREWVAHPGSEEVVQGPQAFAWNPSITGTKIEETALVIDGRIELITTSPGWPSIAITAQGVELAAPGILIL